MLFAYDGMNQSKHAELHAESPHRVRVARGGFPCSRSPIAMPAHLMAAQEGPKKARRLPPRIAASVSLSSRRRGPNHCVAGAAVLRDHLGAPETSGPALLLKPAALRPNSAGGQRFRDGRKDLDNARGKVAVLPIEMPALLLNAGRRQTENLSRLDRSRKPQDFGGCRNRLFQVSEARLRGSSGNHPQDTAAGHFRLCAWAKECAVSHSSVRGCRLVHAARGCHATRPTPRVRGTGRIRR